MIDFAKIKSEELAQLETDEIIRKQRKAMIFNERMNKYDAQMEEVRQKTQMLLKRGGSMAPFTYASDGKPLIVYSTKGDRLPAVVGQQPVIKSI